MQTEQKKNTAIGKKLFSHFYAFVLDDTLFLVTQNTKIITLISLQLDHNFKILMYK